MNVDAFPLNGVILCKVLLHLTLSLTAVAVLSQCLIVPN